MGRVGNREKVRAPLMASKRCAVCGCALNWRERGGVCRACDPAVAKDGTVPYPQFCMHPERCDGLSSCPRDYSCVE